MGKIHMGVTMILRSLSRRRIVLILIGVVPLVFLTVVQVTSSDLLLPFKLASIGEDTIINMPEKAISLTFFAVASVGFLISFLALTLIQKNCKEGKRLVICGYHPVELFIAVFIALTLFTIVISIYVGLLTNGFYPVKHLIFFISGLALTGFIYGAYGLVVGALIKGELEGILLILLLVNIDAGWLQNPLFYAQAQNQVIIEYLPAYFPSQVSIISAFADYSIYPAVFNSVVYGGMFLIASAIIFYYKMRLKS